MQIVAPMPQEGGPRIPQNPIFLKSGKKSSKTQKLKYVQKYAKISDKPFDQRSLIHREVWFPGGPRIPKNPFFFVKRKKSPKTQKFRNVQKYDKISDMPFDQRSLIHWEAWFPPCFVGQRIPQNPFFFLQTKIIQNAKTQKCLEIGQNQRYALRPEVSNPLGSVVSGQTKKTPNPDFFLKTKKIIQNAKTQKRLEICQNQRYALRPEVSNPSGSVVSTMFCKAKSAKKKKNCAAFFDHFQAKMFNVRPFLSITFPLGFCISKNIGHPTLGSGGKKTFKRYLKSEQTDRRKDGRMDRQTDNISTYKKHRPRGPLL